MQVSTVFCAKHAELEEKIKKAEEDLRVAKEELKKFQCDECPHLNKRPFFANPAMDLIDSAFTGMWTCPDCGHCWYP